MPRRISIRKIIQTLVTIVAVAGCAVAMISADRAHSRRKIKGVQLQVKSPSGVHFLTEEAVRSMLFASRHINPLGMSIEQLNERSMEAILRANPWVRDAQIWTDAGCVMHIILTQRVPLVRIFEEDGNSYYLDAALQAMPLSSQYSHYVPVVTGVPKLGADSAAMVVKGRITGLVQRIAQDTFWNAQVSQIEMRIDGGFELIPVLGRQRIILGDTARLREKLDNLFAFYRQIQNKVGWDKYKTLDLRYAGQVVASPSLPWKAPVDKAISNMSWLQAIMDNAPANAAQLGGDAAAFADSSAAPSSPAPSKLSIPVAAVKTHVGVKPAPAKPSANPHTLVTGTKKPVNQSAARPVKPRLPARSASTLKNTSHHQQNTPPNAATNR